MPASNADVGNANGTGAEKQPDKPEPPKGEVKEAKLEDIHKDFAGDKKGARERWETKLVRFAVRSFALTDVGSGGKPWLAADDTVPYYARCVLAQRDEAENKLLNACAKESLGIVIEGKIKEMERDYKRQVNVLAVTDCKVVAPTPDSAAKTIRDCLAKGNARNAVDALAWLGKYQRAGILKNGDALTGAVAKEVDALVASTTHIEIAKLLGDFKADAGKAHNDYQDVELELMGRIKDVSKNEYGLVSFTLHDEAGNFVECYTRKEGIEEAAKTASIVTIRGNCVGERTTPDGTKTGKTNLVDCAVVPAK